ncbi:MAG: chromosome segregation protein SMC [Planctomycetaceae bacterium]
MLKSLELLGFKSFADRTRFDFAPGITGVVGPNGSGKSNVVDAIKWILGDQSAKSLRGKEMVDVIFNGAAGRKPAGLAEATLTFDNSNGFLPLETPEVQIGRRIWRSGEAEYLINKGSARLKDVRDLFMGTGAGASAYCIIEQGRVDQILQANPTNRRMVFEEAAGISRFKARRIAAEKNLERVDQNLLRLTDIVDEVEAQLNALRSQAVKAARYREIHTKLKDWWLGFAADQCRVDRERLARVDGTLKQHQIAVEELNAKLKSLEESLSDFDTEINSVDNRLRDAERRSSALREQVAGHDTSLRHQAARKDELDHDLSRLRKQRLEMQARTQETIAEFDRAKEQLVRSEQELAERRATMLQRDAELAELESEIASRRARIEQLKEAHATAIQQSGNSSRALAQAHLALDSARSSIVQLEERIVGLDLQIETIREECAEYQERFRAASDVAAAAGERLRALQTERKSLLGAQDQFQRSLFELREQRSASQARKTVLEDLESRQEGLGIGVKEILSRAQNADVAPWNQIIGSVADLLEVDLEQAALLEVALGHRAQLIVIKEFVALLEYLDQATVPIQGRVGFVALFDDNIADAKRRNSKVPTASRRESLRFEQFRVDPQSMADLNGLQGVQCRADAMVRSSPKAPSLARKLFADTWIVDDLETALELSAGAGRGCRFVTLQGELLDADATLTVGTIRTETAFVSRKSELRRLRQDLVQLDKQIAEEERRIDGLEASVTSADSRLDAAEVELKAAVDTQVERRSELAAQEHRLERIVADRDAVLQEIAVSVSRTRQLEVEVESATAAATAAEAMIHQLQEERASAERELTESDARIHVLREARNSERIDVAKQEERLQGLENACERLEQDRVLRMQHRDESERRFEAASEQRRQITLHILNLNSTLAELMLQQESAAHEAGTLMGEREKLRGRRAILLKEEAALREQRRVLSDEQHKAEFEVRDITHQINSLGERIEEEYQLSLNDVIESGASAVHLLQQERDGVDGEADEAPEVSAGEPSDSTAETDRPDASRAELSFADVREEIEARVNRLRRQLKLMGSVNTDSLRDLDELERRFGHLSEQLDDLVQAKRALEEIVRRINTESERMFAEAFESIRNHFRELFRKLFGGGEGDVILEDPNDILECGIDIVARPPGKELRSITLLSGGEKTLTAVALLLSIFKSRPSPFCILDEVDAALDEANVDRFVALLREFRETTQFIMITHSKRSMTVADVLYGVTMEQSGVSKRMSVRFDEVGENGELKTGGAKSSEKSPASNRRDRDAA